jgi:hypothetical protein
MAKEPLNSVQDTTIASDENQSTGYCGDFIIGG